MTCLFCDMIQKNEGVVYSDSHIVALLHPLPATVGHVVVMPREHIPIFENIPDYRVADLMKKAKKISVGVFETIKCEGTNVMIQSGVAAGQKYAHAMVHIIPRQEGDNLPLGWKPRQFNEEELSVVELKLKEAAKDIGAFEKEQAKPKEVKAPEKISGEKDYLVKGWERVP